MKTSWERHADETEEWYDRFALYLYKGPDRTIADAHTFATRLAKGAAHGQLSSWRRAAKRHQWQERAADFDAEAGRKTLATLANDSGWTNEERLRMVAELLHQVYGVLRQADLLTLSKEEARQLLPTFRLFFRDLLQFHQTEAAQFLTANEGAGKGDAELSADDLVKFLSEMDGLQSLVSDLKRVADSSATEESWRPLRDALAQLYPDEASARRIADQAQLDGTRIHFSTRAVDSWHAILTEAAHAGGLEKVIQAAQQEYGANVALAKAVQHVRQAYSPNGLSGKKVRVRRKA
jgi:hypothetical protein